jgi:hypothetical protein
VAILPFIDRTATSVGEAQITISVNDGMDTTDVDAYRQGISIRSFADYSCILVPTLTPNGFPAKTSTRFNFSVEQTTFGIVELWEDPGEDGTPAPFEDITGNFDAKTYLTDTGTQIYPVVLFSPVLRDPSTMNGVIEPLAIRTKLSTTNTEGPEVAHDIRATLLPNEGAEIVGMFAQIGNFIKFNSPSKIAPFYDAQDVLMENSEGTYRLSAPGFNFPEPRSIAPFDESINLNTSTLTVADGSLNALDLTGLDAKYGIYGKSSTTGFEYRSSTSVKLRKTGAQRVLGVDSIAFGGFKK